MKFRTLAIAVAMLSTVGAASAQIGTTNLDKVPARDLGLKLKEPWSVATANNRAEFKGEIVIGKDEVRKEDSEITINVIMTNGQIVNLKVLGGSYVGTADRKVFKQQIRGEAPYVDNLNIAFVEVIHWRRGLDELTRTNIFKALPAMSYTPDEFDFNEIRITGTVFRKNPAGGAETQVESREVLNQRPMRKMTYGMWTSSAPAANFDVPPEVRDASGFVAISVLTGEDDMKDDRADAAILLQIPGGTIRHPIGGIVGLDPYSFYNADTFYRNSTRVQWRAIGKAGVFYRFGDHGLTRDDWDVRGIFVDFSPDLPGLRSGVRFRKHTLYPSNNTKLARVNGDGGGQEIWAPFPQQ